MSFNMEDYSIQLIFMSLVFSAFFSGMELAYLSSNRLKVELQIQKKKISSSVLKTIYKSESTMIVLMLLGNNIALVIYGISMAEALSPIWTNLNNLNQPTNIT